MHIGLGLCDGKQVQVHIEQGIGDVGPDALGGIQKQQDELMQIEWAQLVQGNAQKDGAIQGRIHSAFDYYPNIKYDAFEVQQLDQDNKRLPDHVRQSSFFLPENGRVQR